MGGTVQLTAVQTLQLRQFNIAPNKLKKIGTFLRQTAGVQIFASSCEIVAEEKLLTTSGYASTVHQKDFTLVRTNKVPEVRTVTWIVVDDRNVPSRMAVPAG